MAQINHSFNPLLMLQGDKLDFIKNKTMSKKMAEFDAIWMYQIIGKRFLQISNPLQLGVFESQNCYFVVFYSSEKVAIALWRGSD